MVVCYSSICKASLLILTIYDIIHRSTLSSTLNLIFISSISIIIFLISPSKYMRFLFLCFSILLIFNSICYHFRYSLLNLDSQMSFYANHFSFLSFILAIFLLLKNYQNFVKVSHLFYLCYCQIFLFKMRLIFLLRSSQIPYKIFLIEIDLVILKFTNFLQNFIN